MPPTVRSASTARAGSTIGTRISCEPAASISSRTIASIFFVTRMPRGIVVYTPAISLRTKAPRSSRRWLGASASAGSSLSVRAKSFDSRMRGKDTDPRRRCAGVGDRLTRPGTAAENPAHATARIGLGLAPDVQEPGAPARLIRTPRSSAHTPRADGPGASSSHPRGGAACRHRSRSGPDRATFASLAEAWPLVPVWAELLADVSTPVGLFPALAGDGPGLLLESVERSERWGRYSFVAGDPAAVIVADRSGVHIRDLARAGAPAGRRRGAAAPALIEIAHALRAPRMPGLPPLTGGLMGYVAFEAAELLDGHPVPDPASAPAPPIGLLVVDRAVVFDHWTQRLILVAHVPPGGYDDGVAALEHLATTIAGASPPDLAPVSAGAAEVAGLAQHARCALPRDRVHVQGAHPRRGHLPGRALPPAHLPRAGGRVPRLPAPARRQPRPLHVLPADAGPRARRLLARAARAGRRTPGVHAAPRGDPPAWRDGGPRPTPRTRAPRRPQGAGRARDARGPRPQRPRPGVRAGQRDADRADAGRAVHQGHAHRLDRGGRPPRGSASARCARGDLPGRDALGSAEAPGDGADRGTRARRARTLRRRGGLPAPSRATSTSASRSGPPS